MEKLLYYDQDSNRIRAVAGALNKLFEVSIASNLLEVGLLLKKQRPTIALFGFASQDYAFNAYHLNCIYRSILSARLEEKESLLQLSIFIMVRFGEQAFIHGAAPDMPGKSLLDALKALPSTDVHVIQTPPQIRKIPLIILSILNDSSAPPVTEPTRQDITYPFADEHSPIIGKSKKFHQMIAQIRSCADKERPVLIIGETGTGKELAARSLHSWSKRKHNPFVALNCAAIPPTLFESEMFGTERGAYTDAPTRSGAIEQAHNGTLFLDEIGNLSTASQPSLLRVLETKEYRRLGSTQSHMAQFRLVSASSLNLIDLAAEKCFRKDLLFRIADFILEIPPLRERTEDIPLLARHFCTQLSKDIYDIEDPALDKLSAHDWPGNIRELQSVIARACTRRIAGKITADDIEFLTGISRLGLRKE